LFLLGAVIVLFTTMIIGVPIPLVFMASSIFLVVFGGFNATSLIPYGFSKLNSILLLTIPLFILAGSVMNKGGIGQQLVRAIEKKFGKFKGNLSVVTVISCAVFGAVSGSASATLTSIGGIMYPKMIERGYEKGFITALLSSAGVLGLLIPPSMSMILFAWVGGQSVLACFLATVIPGLVLVLLLSIISVRYAHKNPNVSDNVFSEIGNIRENNKKEAGEAGPLAALIMPILILGTIYGGILTPTEAAAISVVYAIPVGFLVYKQLTFKTVKDALIDAGKTSGVIMIMMFAVMILSRLYIMNNVPKMIISGMSLISNNNYVLLIIINIILVLIGMMMDDTSGILLCTPILMPVMIELGISPIQFAAIIGVNLGMGNITPPTAPLLYLGGRLVGSELHETLNPLGTMFLFAWIPVLIIVTFVPEVSMFLPRLFGLCN